MMKKILTFLVCLLLCGAVGFVICGILFDWFTGDALTVSIVDTFTVKETVVSPSCTEEGYLLRTGPFGKEERTDFTPPLGHRYVAAVMAPTCTEGGSTTYTCADCGDTYSGAPTAPAGHSYDRVTLAATCLAGGYTTHTCTACGHSYRDGETTPTGHIYLPTVTSPTCTEAGYTTHTCTGCGDAYRDTPVAMLGHSNHVEVMAPTCTDPGITLTVCQRCSTASVSDHKVALGHDYTAGVTAATCTTEGYTTKTCARCRDTYTENRQAALGHDPVSYLQYATTTAKGGLANGCRRCKDVQLSNTFTYAQVFDGRQGDGGPVLYEGVDLSYHNGTVDFAALKASGISFVILRVGTSRTPDSMFETYYRQAKAAGLDVGAYIYTYASTTAAALRDAEWMLGKLEGKTFEYPIFFDIEDNSLTSLSRKALTDITMTFCDTMVDAGYYPGVYTNKRWIADHLDIARIRAHYDIWLASWIVTGENIGDYSDDFAMWQYTATGAVSGVSTDVDRNRVYRDFPTYIKKYGYNGYGGGT